MCLAVPGKVLEVEEKTALVDFGGLRREVRLDLLEGARKGDYVIVHAGYAIQVLDQAEAERTLRDWTKIAGLGRSTSGEGI